MHDISKNPISVVLKDRERLPEFLRPLHRLQTAVPEPGSKIRKTTPLRIFAADGGLMVAFLALAGLGAALASKGFAGALVGLPLAAFAIMAAVGRMRRLVVSHVHEASHGIVAKFYRERGMSKRKAEMIAEAILDLGSALTLTLNGQDYRTTHALHHEFAHLGTLTDPDGETLHEWGIWPDRVDNLPRALLLTAVNPLWHLRFARDRIMSNVARGKLYRRALGAAMLAMVLGSALVLPFPVWLAAVFLPFGPGYQLATLAQLTTIHPYGYCEGAQTLEDYAERMWDRIPYRPMPARGATIGDWVQWAWAMSGHGIARLTVLDDTMVPHGYHHLAWPIGRAFDDWWNTAQYWVDAYVAGVLPKGATERIVWGLPEAWKRQQAHFVKCRE